MADLEADKNECLRRSGMIMILLVTSEVTWVSSNIESFCADFAICVGRTWVANTAL